MGYWREFIFYFQEPTAISILPLVVVESLAAIMNDNSRGIRERNEGWMKCILESVCSIFLECISKQVIICSCYGQCALTLCLVVSDAKRTSRAKNAAEKI